MRFLGQLALAQYLVEYHAYFTMNSIFIYYWSAIWLVWFFNRRPHEVV